MDPWAHFATLLALLVVGRLALLVADAWALLDLFRRPAEQFVPSGMSRLRWRLVITVVPFASLYYLFVVRDRLDAQAVRLAHREVLYDPRGWDGPARTRLVEALERRHIAWTFESGHLVVAKADERAVDAVVGRHEP